MSAKRLSLLRDIWGGWEREVAKWYIHFGM